MNEEHRQHPCDAREVIKLVAEESGHRPIVPFLGAGISVAAGFPTIRLVAQYLAKVDFAIQKGVFENRFPHITGHSAAHTYKQHPGKYLEDCGWPNAGQLNADLWAWLGKPGKGKEGKGRDLIRKNDKDRDEPILRDLLSRDITQNGGQKRLDLRDHLRALTQWMLRDDLAKRNESAAALGALREWLRWKDWYFGKEEAEPRLLHGDWEILLDRLCEGNFDLADALFTSFEQGLKPTLSHRYLAFLQPKLGIPLILTTNFDSFMERALRGEGTEPKVFDVHRDAQLPDPELVRRQPSVLKLHGSAYGLRLGERLKYPLEAQARSSVLRFLPPDALLLVMGFSGSERRIMQMLQLIAQNTPKDARKRLIWVQGPGEPGPLFQELRCEPGMKWCRIRHLDSFLQELYFHIAGSYQSSSRPYTALPGHTETGQVSGKSDEAPGAKAEERSSGIAGTANETPKAPEESVPETLAAARAVERRPVHIFLADQGENKPSSSWASLAGTRFTDPLEYDYKIIAIDLENHHTVEGIVAEIFERVRVIDPLAPGCAITTLDPVSAKTTIKKVVDRIGEVFQRGRWILVLDSVESFGRAQMVHHGVRSLDKIAPSKEEVWPGLDAFNEDIKKLEDQFNSRIGQLEMFLKALLHLDGDVETSNIEAEMEASKICYWDAYVVVTAGNPRPRYASGTEPGSVGKIRDLIKILENNNGDKPNHVHTHSQDEKGYGELGIDLVDPTGKLPEHWRPAAEPPEEPCQRSKQRAGDALALLQVLQAPPDSGKIAESAMAALIGLLALFRRPRPRPLLRSIIERWALRGNSDEERAIKAHDCVDDALTRLTGIDGPLGMVAQIHEGGMIWLFREAHQAAYDALTEQLRTRYWVEAWIAGNNSPAGASVVGAVMDGMLLIAWHLFAARAYYADMLLPTQDIQAFYEYLYQRVSAIRVTSLLIAIVAKNQENDEWTTPFGALPGVTGTKLEALRDYADKVGLFEPIPTPNAFEDIKALRTTLIGINKKSLETLYAALRKNRDLFRSRATPDSVIAWSRQFLDRELPDMQGDLLGLSEEANNHASIDKLKLFFEDLAFDARFSKLDFEGMLLDRLLLSNAKSTEEAKPKNKDELKEKLCKQEEMMKISIRGFPSSEEVSDQHLIPFNRFLALRIRTLHCLIYLDHLAAEGDISRLLANLAELTQAGGKQPRVEANKAKRALLELHCMALFRPWSFWQPLVKRESSAERVTDENKNMLNAAVRASRDYEDMIRETTVTGAEDAHHRSSALALRARALYLQGHFSQAHHFLDLAPAGLQPERIDHRLSLAVIHIVRAELLAISADEHYFSGTPKDQVVKNLLRRKDWDGKTDPFGDDDIFEELEKKLRPFLQASLKKIRRAEQELVRAEDALDGMAHQNLWRVALEFGWAQVRLEWILFQLENLFWEWPRLDESAYLRESGVLEQSILDGLRRLRNVFDAIPYCPLRWEDKEEKRKTMGIAPSMADIEVLAFELWRQFFVAGAYYSSLLSDLLWHCSKPHRENATAIKNGIVQSLATLAITGESATHYREQWESWCAAMRFDSFQTIDPLSADAEGSAKPWVSLRKTVIERMKWEKSANKNQEMWNKRRDLPSNKPVGDGHIGQ